MPEHDDQAVRAKYGLKSGSASPTRKEKANMKERDFGHERTILLQQVEQLCRFFLTRGEVIVDNSSLNAEELCTVIELCLDHGIRGNIAVF